MSTAPHEPISLPPHVRGGGRRPSPYRAHVLATLAVFWATLLLALGVPRAGSLLVLALLGAAAVAAWRLLGVRLRRVRRPVRAGARLRPALERTAAAVRRVRALRPRRGSLRGALERAGSAARSVRLPRPTGSASALRDRARRRVRSLRPPRRRRSSPPAPAAARATEAWDLCRLGTQLRGQGRLAAAVEAFETAVWIFRDREEPRGLALALNGLGLALVRQRRLDHAVACYREAVSILEALGDGHAHGQVLANLGAALRTQGRSDEARASWEDALARLEPGSAEYVRLSELRAAS